MSDNETASDDTDLDTFSEMLFNNKPAEDKPEATGEPDEDEALEPDALEPEDLNDEQDDVEEEIPLVKPKSRFQERIDELTAKTKESDRKADELRIRLEEAIAKLNAKEDKPEPIVESKKEADGPNPDETNEDGSDKYPLGEFDPAYIRDLTRYSFRKEMEATKAAETEAAKQREVEEAKNALQTQWDGKLETAKEKYPDMSEKNMILRDTLSNIEPSFGQYLANTIMGMEYGTDVLYYLASNVDEAKKIANSGPTAATIALGRLEAKFMFQAENKDERKPKVSKAPEPPENLNRGSFVNKDIAGDTDDLDRFAAALFNNKSKRRF